MIYKTFLASNTAKGFVGYFSDFMASHRTIILKGGPGTGKSTLMKKLARTAEKTGEDVWLFYCSSDPDSLDGVFFPSRNFVVLDGTSPHALDATVPAINESIINLLSAVDGNALLPHEDEIRALIKQKKQRFAAAYAALKASAELDKHASSLILDSADAAELAAVIDSVYADVSTAECSGEKRFFYDAFTPDGLIVGTDGFDEGYEKTAVKTGNRFLSVYAVNAVADRLKAVKKPFTAFYSAEWPDLVCQLIVGEKLITGVKDFGSFDKVYALSDKPVFDKNAVTLQNAAIKSLNEARECHKQIEKYYVQAIDFGIVSDLTDKIKQTIGL